MLSGTYEPAVERALQEHLIRGRLWDVGAHIGYLTLVGLRLGGRVVAIEPNPENAARIRSTLEANGFSADVVEMAVGRSPGRTFLARGSDSSTGRISHEGVDVPLTTLDELRKGAPAPTVVKIDVEGYEEEVLAGATRVIEVDRPVFIIETHPWASEEATLSHLRGYDVLRLDSHHLIARPRSGCR